MPLVLLLVPIGFFVAMWALYSPIRHQQALTGSRDPAAFEAAVQASGGPRSPRIGLLIDLGFVATVLAVVPPVFAAYGRLWWVPLAAGVLDLFEDALALRLLARGASVDGVSVLRATSTAKLLAYVAIPAVLVWIGIDAARG